MCLTREQRKAGISLFLGLVIGVPSIYKIFEIIFREGFNSGNKSAFIVLFLALFIGILFTLNSIAIFLGYKNLGELITELFEGEE